MVFVSLTLSLSSRHKKHGQNSTKTCESFPNLILHCVYHLQPSVSSELHCHGHCNTISSKPLSTPSNQPLSNNPTAQQNPSITHCQVKIVAHDLDFAKWEANFLKSRPKLYHGLDQAIRALHCGLVKPLCCAHHMGYT